MITLQQKMKRVENHMIGLWRFRVWDKTPLWCCTFSYRGRYNDTEGKETVEEALDAVYESLQKIRRKNKR